MDVGNGETPQPLGLNNDDNGRVHKGKEKAILARVRFIICVLRILTAFYIVLISDSLLSDGVWEFEQRSIYRS
jgi:hypothetical protein